MNSASGWTWAAGEREEMCSELQGLKSTFQTKRSNYSKIEKSTLQQFNTNNTIQFRRSLSLSLKINNFSCAQKRIEDDEV